MALIACPDCGSSVSDVAQACPKCARPIAATPTISRTPVPKQKKGGVSAGTTLVVFLFLGAWIYYQATSWSASPDGDSSQVSASAEPTDTTAKPAAAEEPATFVTTPAELYQQYSANEVATDQRIGGRIVEFTAPVQAIDKDFTDSAVLKFSTGDEFGEMQANLDDSEKSAAADLSQGELVTVRCKKMQRIMNSPIGSDCTFQAATKSDQTGTSDEAPADGGARQSSAAEPSNAAPATSTVASLTAPAETPPSDSSSSENEAEPPTVLQQVEANTAGPSFDCTKASDPTATTICSNADLSLLDRQMAILYYSRTNYATDRTVRDEQRAWIRDRDSSCSADVVCLRGKYNQRIQQLQQ